MVFGAVELSQRPERTRYMRSGSGVKCARREPEIARINISHSLPVHALLIVHFTRAHQRRLTMTNRFTYLLAAGLLLGGCSQEQEKQREADNARKDADKAQADADAERTRADAKQVRADAEAKAHELEKQADAVEKGAGDRPTVVTEEKKTTRYETVPARRR